MTSYGSDYADHDEQFDVEALLRRAIELVDTGRSMPLSDNVILPRNDMRELLIASLENLPAELREAIWLLRERVEFRNQMQREGDEILRMATEKAERMVQRSELVREAQRTAQRVIAEADAEARRLRNEAEDYVDQTLANFEVTLENTYRQVQAGREKLRGEAVVHLDEAVPAAAVPGVNEGAFFDQENERRRRS